MGIVTARIPDETVLELDRLAKSTRRSKSFLLGEALRLYLDSHAWQVASIEQGLEQAGQGRFATKAQVNYTFAKMGLKNG
jgi:RHH-type rel operon transcriptional repressor/antitoxin RelB